MAKITNPAFLLLLAVGALFCAYLGACCSYVLLLSERAPPPSPAAAAARGLRTAPPAAAGGGGEEEDEAAAKAATRAALGRASWELLHRMAASFDKAPTPQRSADAAQFFGLLSTLYPCPDCAAHFAALLKEAPVDARDNKRLSIWLCKAHNSVNQRLGKPAFPCALEQLAERWGSCGCFGNLTSADKLLS